MLAEMAQSICNRCNALTFLEQRISALKTSNINVLQETRRFYSPASRKTWVPNRGHLNSAYAVMSLVIHFTIVEPELKDVFICNG